MTAQELRQRAFPPSNVDGDEDARVPPRIEGAGQLQQRRHAAVRASDDHDGIRVTHLKPTLRGGAGSPKEQIRRPCRCHRKQQEADPMRNALIAIGAIAVFGMPALTLAAPLDRTTVVAQVETTYP